MSNSTTALSVAGIRQDGIISVDTIKKNREAIQTLLTEVLKSGIDRDYAIIPGTKKNTLLKPGAEKICSLFGMAVKPYIERIPDGDDFVYVVTAEFSSIASGVYLGSGIGEASTRESKYAWRAAVCDEEFQATDPHKRRLHWKKGFNNAPPESVAQVREDPNDKANTVLKMAKKRAMIDGVLTITAASDTFTQDLEPLLDKNGGKSTAGVSGNQVASAMEEIISTEDSKKFFGRWKNIGKHSKATVTEYLTIHCGGITDDRKMPKRCYEDAMKWAGMEGAPIPPKKEEPKSAAAVTTAPAQTKTEADDPVMKNIGEYFAFLGINLAEQAALFAEYRDRFSELAIELKSRLDAQTAEGE